MKNHIQEREYSRYWRVDEKGEFELLHACYRTHRFAPHWHSTLCVAVIQRGALQYTCERQQGISPAGTLCVIRPGEVHTGWPHLQTELEYRSFYIGSPLLQSVREEVAPHCSPASSTIVPKDEIISSLIHLHTVLQTSSGHLERESTMWIALEHLVFVCSGMVLPTQRIQVPSGVQRVRECIESCYADDLSLNHLAQLVDVSPFQCLRMFQKAYRLTPHEYLTQVRVQRAQALLAQGEAIAQVAAVCGFVDQSHLGRHFKRIVGVTPGKYLSLR